MAIQNIILKGISRVPDDSASGGGELQAAVNLANDGAGLKMIEKPASVFALASGEECVFIHQTSEYKHYIIVLTEGDTKRLVWVDSTELGEETIPRHDMYSDTTTDPKTLYYLNGELKTISAIGNTLCFADDDGLGYILFSENEYGYLGQKPPFIEIKFGLDCELVRYPEAKDSEPQYNVISFSDAAGSEQWASYCIPHPSDDDTYELVGTTTCMKTSAKQHKDQIVWTGNTTNIKGSTYNGSTEGVDSISNSMSDKFMAAMNLFLSLQTDKNKFIYPFFVRYAYELYDGSHIMHSYPVLLIPNSRGPVLAIDRGRFSFFIIDNKVQMNIQGNIIGFSADLYNSILKMPEGLSKWKDVVKGINIYATAPIYTYDQGGKVYGWKNMESGTNVGVDFDPWNDYYTNGRVNGYANFGKNRLYDSFIQGMYLTCNFQGDSCPYWIVSLPEKEITDVRENITSAGVFYKLKEYTIDEILKLKTNTLYKVDIDEKVLTNLTNKEQLDDDYHSHDNLKISDVYIYNKRVNLGGVTRTMHKPLNILTQFPIVNATGSDYSSQPQTKEIVYVSNGENTEVIVSDTVNIDWNKNDFPNYIFYPNANAKRIYLRFNSGWVEVLLKEHPSLEGAYWCTNLWGVSYPQYSGFDGESRVYNELYEEYEAPITTATSCVVNEKGKVYTSNVENPFTFKATNINTVGDGEIRALCANTQPVNAYNFGLATMYAFTSEGVWGLKVNDTGGWSSVQPITRDVITEGTKPLPLGQNIVFLSNRGVLRIDINSSLTKLMSMPIEGYVDGNFLHISDVLSAIGESGMSQFLNEYNRFWLDGSTQMMYDYMHSRILFSNKTYGCWVYNLKGESWTQTQTHVDNALNSYPQCEFVQGSDVVMLDVSDSFYTNGLLLTRPISTGSEWFSRLKQVALRGHFYPHGNEVKLALFGSRDWHDYALVATSTTPRITRHYGSGFRSHSVLAYINTDDTAFSADRVVLDIEGDELDKLR